MAHFYLIYTTILLKGASVFCWILVFGIFFTQLRNPDLWFMMLVIWYVLLLVQMWLLEVESFSIPGICPTSDVAEQKLITFLGEVGGSFKTPSRWWLWLLLWLLWLLLLRVNTGNPCRWDTHLGNMRLSHLSKTCPWKNDLRWNDLQPWWNLRKGSAQVLALSIRGIQGCIWISYAMIQLQICMDIFLLGKACLSSQIIPSCPGMNCQGSAVFLWRDPNQSTARSFHGFSLLWYLILKTDIYFLHWIFTKSGHLWPHFVRWPGFSYVWDYALSRNCKLLGADGQVQNEESSGATGAWFQDLISHGNLSWPFLIRGSVWFSFVIAWYGHWKQPTDQLLWTENFPTDFNNLGCQILVVSNSKWDVFLVFMWFQAEPH